MNAQLTKPSNKIISAVKGPAVRTNHSATGTSTVEALKHSAQRYEDEKHRYAQQREKLLTEVTQLQQLRTRLLASLGEEESIIGSSSAFITDLNDHRIPAVESLFEKLSLDYNHTVNRTVDLENYTGVMKTNYDNVIQVLRTALDDDTLAPLRKKFEHLQATHRSLQTVLRDDNDKVQHYHELIAALQRQRQTDTEAIETLNRKYQTLLQDNATVEKEVEISTIRYEELKLKISERTDQRTQFETRLNTVKGQYTTLQQTFTDETAQQSTAVSSLETDIHQAEEELRTAEKKMEELKIQRTRIEQEHRLVYGDYTDALRNVEKKKRSLENVEDELSTLQSDLEQARDKQDELEESLSRAQKFIEDAQLKDASTVKINGNITTKRLELSNVIKLVEDKRVEASILYDFLNLQSTTNKSVNDFLHQLSDYGTVYDNYADTIAKIRQQWMDDVTSLGLTLTSTVANTDQISTILTNTKTLMDSLTTNVVSYTASPSNLNHTGLHLRKFLRTLTDTSTQLLTGVESIKAFLNHAAATVANDEATDSSDVQRTKHDIVTKESEVTAWETKLRTLRDQRNALQDQLTTKQASSTGNARVQAMKATVQRNIELVRKSMDMKLNDWRIRHQQTVERYDNEHTQLLKEFTKVQHQLTTLEDEKERLQIRKPAPKSIPPSTVGRVTIHKRPVPSSPVGSEAESEASSIIPTNPEAFARLQAMKTNTTIPNPIPGILKTGSSDKRNTNVSSSSSGKGNTGTVNSSGNGMERNRKDRRVDFDVSRNSAYSDHRSVWDNDSLADNDSDHSPMTTMSPYTYGDGTGVSSTASSYAYSIPKSSKPVTTTTTTKPSASTMISSSSSSGSIWDENDIFSSPLSLPRSSPILSDIDSATKPVTNKGTNSAPAKTTTVGKSTSNGTKPSHSAPPKTVVATTGSRKGVPPSATSTTDRSSFPKGSNNGYHNQTLLSTLVDEEDAENYVPLPSSGRRYGTSITTATSTAATTNPSNGIVRKLPMETGTSHGNTTTNTKYGTVNKGAATTTITNKTSSVGKNNSNRLASTTVPSTATTKASSMSSTLNDIFSDTGLW